MVSAGRGLRHALIFQADAPILGSAAPILLMHGKRGVCEQIWELFQTGGVGDPKNTLVVNFSFN